MTIDENGRRAATSLRMSRQARRDTAPELALRKALHARGWRFRVDHPLPGLPRRRADLWFSKRRVAVFVDGCFWHSCPLHATLPRTNHDWWLVKLRRNQQRDMDSNRHLEELGFVVVRIWEHESVEAAVMAVERALSRT